MKKVSILLLLATMLFASGGAKDVSAKEIAKTEVPGIEKSYSVTAGPTNDIPNMVCSEGLYQDDVYYFEETAYGNYTIPKFEEVYIEMPEMPPITA